MLKRGRGGFTAPRRIGDPAISAGSSQGASAAPATTQSAARHDEEDLENVPAASLAPPCAGKAAAPASRAEPGYRAPLAQAPANTNTGAYGFEPTAPAIKRPPGFQRPAMVPTKLPRTAPASVAAASACVRGANASAGPGGSAGGGAAGSGSSGPAMEEVFGVLFTKTALLAKVGKPRYRAGQCRTLACCAPEGHNPVNK